MICIALLFVCYMWYCYFYILVVYTQYHIIVLLFVCMLYVVWLVLDGSLCREGFAAI